MARAKGFALLLLLALAAVAVVAMDGVKENGSKGQQDKGGQQEETQDDEETVIDASGLPDSNKQGSKGYVDTVKKMLTPKKATPTPAPTVSEQEQVDPVKKQEAAPAAAAPARKAREKRYLAESRFEVKDEQVPWAYKFPIGCPFAQPCYNPVEYTASKVLAQPVWADLPTISDAMTFNGDQLSADGQKILVNRKSHHGPYKFDEKSKRPLNPRGRTGMTGRGLLGRWGPNHAADPIVTRFLRDESGQIIMTGSGDGCAFEFVAIERGDTPGVWAIPGGMVDPGESVSVTLKREFAEEALNAGGDHVDPNMTAEQKAAREKKKTDIANQMAKEGGIFNKGHTVYKGYVDDPRNTDNAWMETVAVNFHDVDGNAMKEFKLHAGDDALKVAWFEYREGKIYTKAGQEMQLYASHAEFIQATHDYLYAKYAIPQAPSMDDAVAKQEEEEDPKYWPIGENAHTAARGQTLGGRYQPEERFEFPDAMVSWEADGKYTPTEYTASSVLAEMKAAFSYNPAGGWADPTSTDLFFKDWFPQIKFNAADTDLISGLSINRVSHEGEYKLGPDGRPRNPRGRTGMTGRGRLGRWGPNHAADPIVTRWARNDDGSVKMDGAGKPIMQFVTIQRKDNKQWAIPGGMVDPGEKGVSTTLMREFLEEAMAEDEKSSSSDAEQDEKMMEKVKHVFGNGHDIYKGVVDDPRNTDNAWMETVAVNFHDETGEGAGSWHLRAGDDAGQVKWMTYSADLKLYASHADFITSTYNWLQSEWAAGRAGATPAPKPVAQVAEVQQGAKNIENDD